MLYIFDEKVKGTMFHRYQVTYNSNGVRAFGTLTVY